MSTTIINNNHNHNSSSSSSSSSSRRGSTDSDNGCSNSSNIHNNNSNNNSSRSGSNSSNSSSSGSGTNNSSGSSSSIQNSSRSMVSKNIGSIIGGIGNSKNSNNNNRNSSITVISSNTNSNSHSSSGSSSIFWRLIRMLLVIGSADALSPSSVDRDIFRYNASHLLDQLLLGYDSRLRPDFGGPPTLVDVNLNIRSMGPISETEMDYQMDCYFRQSWVDRRLEFTGDLKVLQVSINVLDRLWKPDTHFFNGRKSYLHTVTSPNKLLRIHQDGRILYSMRLTIKASCPMHLEKFPMDTQTCPLRFGSHGYGLREVLYIWTHGPQHSIKMASDMTLSQFDLIGFPHNNETVTQPHRGSYSTLYVEFGLRRHMGYFLINVYVPCSLMVVISWVSFWINREATADRIALGITTVLTMAFMGIDNRRDLPKVSYSTALDYFVGTCFAFVLASIIQFAGVHFFTKQGSGEIPPEQDAGVREEEAEEDEEDEVDEQEANYAGEDTSTTALGRSGRYSEGYASYVRRRSMVTGKSNGETSVTLHYRNYGARRSRENFFVKFWNCLLGSQTYRDMKRRTSLHGAINSVSKIDRTSRILFPLTFSVFNIFYWVLYLQNGDTKVLM